MAAPWPPALPVPQAQVRYLLRVTVARGMGQSVVKETPFWVRNPQVAPPAGPPIKVRWFEHGRQGPCRPAPFVNACALVPGACAGALVPLLLASLSAGFAGPPHHL
jgi:hypothetical protein